MIIFRINGKIVFLRSNTITIIMNKNKAATSKNPPTRLFTKFPNHKARAHPPNSNTNNPKAQRMIVTTAPETMVDVFSVTFTTVRR